MKISEAQRFALIARLDRDHGARLAHICNLDDGGNRPTQRQFRARMDLIVQLRKLGYYSRSGLRHAPKERLRHAKGPELCGLFFILSSWSLGYFKTHLATTL